MNSSRNIIDKDPWYNRKIYLSMIRRKGAILLKDNKKVHGDRYSTWIPDESDK